MEQRRTFTKADLTYLANLCFDCRDCYDACQYAPPHEFGVNIPKLMSELRADTYREFTWPAILSGSFNRNALAVTVITAVSIIIILALVLLFQGPDVLFATHLGEGTFYRVVPFIAMTVPPSRLIALYGLTVFIICALRFWRETQGPISALIDPAALWRATKDAFGLAYMKGGGAGCNYPGESFSRARMWYHHLTFYGFLLDLAATTIAAFYHHFLGWQAPYPYFSAPVVLGTVGGVGLIIGTAGLLYLKWQSDRVPADSTMLNMDVVFRAVVFDQLHRSGVARVPRNRGDGNAAGHPLGRRRGTVHYVALWKIRACGLPLRCSRALLDRAAAGGVRIFQTHPRS